jgi:hypothetical protein
MNRVLPKLTGITIFSIAMAFLETAVVIYLRELLYPAGFNFPLAPMPGHLVLTEILREFATILMLAGAGFLAGKTFSQRFAWFIYAFAIWDIFYYIFLKILIDWPESLMTWDILFLIPTTWTGPVISPVIVSLTMIVLALIILISHAKGINTSIAPIEWGLLIFGSVILIVSFTWDYSGFIFEHFSLKELWTLPDKQMLYDTSLKYIPRKFNWAIFLSGEITVVSGILLYFRRIIKSKTLTL